MHVIIIPYKFQLLNGMNKRDKGIIKMSLLYNFMLRYAGKIAFNLSK